MDFLYVACSVIDVYPSLWCGCKPFASEDHFFLGGQEEVPKNLMPCIWGAKGCFFPDTTIHLFFGCHFQIVKDFIGQDSPPHPAVGT